MTENPLNGRAYARAQFTPTTEVGGSLAHILSALVIVSSLIVAAAAILICVAVGPILLVLALVLIPMSVVLSTPKRRHR